MSRPTLYRIYYSWPTNSSPEIVYIGRTSQSLTARLHGHFFKQRLHRPLDLHQVAKIDYLTFSSKADLYVAEIYFINLLKPIFNVDDKATDELSLRLVFNQPISWFIWSNPQFVAKWQDQILIREKQTALLKEQQLTDVIQQREQESLARHARRARRAATFQRLQNFRLVAAASLTPASSPHPLSPSLPPSRVHHA